MKFEYYIKDYLFHLRQLYGKLKRIIHPKPTPDGNAYLHLGCGSINYPNFINIDGIDYPHVHFVQSITNLKQFRDESIKFIYVSHALEHFPRSETLTILQEWRRVLEPGGKLCISVPDFDQILKMYAIGGNNPDIILPPLFGGQDYPFNFHFTTFNKLSLTQALINAGFAHIDDWEHGCDELHSIPDWSGKSILVNNNNIPISLNLEAIK
jgi:predicted SAM-dependent methyltransferase